MKLYIYRLFNDVFYIRVKKIEIELLNEASDCEL